METKTYNLNIDKKFYFKFALNADLNILKSESQSNYIMIGSNSFNTIDIKNEIDGFIILDFNSPSLSDLKDIIFSKSNERLEKLQNLRTEVVHITANLYVTNDLNFEIKMNSGNINIFQEIEKIEFKGNNINFNSDSILRMSDIKINHGNLKIKLFNDINSMNIKLNNGNLQLIKNNYDGTIKGKIKNNIINNTIPGQKYVEFKINTGNYSLI